MNSNPGILVEQRRVKLLASPNVDVNGIDDHGNTALVQAARFGHDEVVTALLIAKADVKTKNDEGQTALMWQPKADIIKPLERLRRLALASNTSPVD